jgi:hypothetical protein
MADWWSASQGSASVVDGRLHHPPTRPDLSAQADPPGEGPGERLLSCIFCQHPITAEQKDGSEHSREFSAVEHLKRVALQLASHIKSWALA